MVIETNAGCTVNVVAPEILPRVALMVEVPTPTPVASPPLVIVATDVFDDIHVTVVVMVFTLPSVYIPVAAYCFVPAVRIVGFAGVTLIDTSAGVVTVKVVEPEML